MCPHLGGTLSSDTLVSAAQYRKLPTHYVGLVDIIHQYENLYKSEHLRLQQPPRRQSPI